MPRDFIFFIFVSICIICTHGMVLNEETNEISRHSNDAGQTSGRKCPNTGCRGGRPGRRRATSIPSTTIFTRSTGGPSVPPPVGGLPSTGIPPAGTTLRGTGGLPPTLLPGSPPSAGVPPPGGALPPGVAPPPRGGPPIGGVPPSGGAPIPRELPDGAASAIQRFTTAKDSEWL